MKTEPRIEVVDKNQLSKSIARRVGLTISDVEKIVDILQDEIITSIKENKKVQLNGFLVFMPRDVEGMTIVSPLDNKEYIIPPKRVVDVRVGKNFKESIKNAYKPEMSEEKKDVSNKKPGRPKKTSK